MRRDGKQSGFDSGLRRLFYRVSISRRQIEPHPLKPSRPRIILAANASSYSNTGSFLDSMAAALDRFVNPAIRDRGLRPECLQTDRSILTRNNRLEIAATSQRSWPPTPCHPLPPLPPAPPPRRGRYRTFNHLHHCRPLLPRAECKRRIQALFDTVIARLLCRRRGGGGGGGGGQQIDATL